MEGTLTKLDYKNSNTELDSNTDADDIDIKFSQKNQGKQFFILLKGLYSNPIGSLIRELVSNCFDAYAEIGIFDKPVFVNLDSDDGGSYLEFVDEGIGMSDERIHKIYLQITESTKENNTDTIGAWGLGSKSPLSYHQEQIYVDTVHNGIRNNFIVYIGDNYLPKASFLIKNEPTELVNGTKVKVYIHENDRLTVISQLKQQLAYFDNVIFNHNIPLENEYIIYENDVYKFRNDVQIQGGNLHIALGKVNYPLDLSQLDINYNELHPLLPILPNHGINKTLELPIGLKFKITDLDITPSRENVRYTEKTKKSIIEKLKLLFKYLDEHIFNKNNIFNEGDFFEYLKVVENKNHKSLNIGGNNFITITSDNVLFNLFNTPIYHEFLPFKDILNIKTLRLRDLFNLDYAKIINETLFYDSNIHSYRYTNRADFSRRKIDLSNILDISSLSSSKIHFFTASSIITILNDKIEIDYPISNEEKKEIVIKNNVSKYKISLFCLDNHDFIQVPNLSVKYNFEKWRVAFGIHKKATGIGITLLKIKNIILNNFKNRGIYDIKDYKLPYSKVNYYLQNRLSSKQKITNTKIRDKKVEIPVRDIVTNTAYDINVNDYKDNKYTGIIVYGALKDKENLETVASFLEIYLNRRNYIFHKKTRNINEFPIFKVFRISETNFKHFEMNNNAIHAKLFNNAKNKLLINAAVTHILKHHVFYNIINKNHNLKFINKKMYEISVEIKQFIHENEYNNNRSDILNYISDFILDNKIELDNHYIIKKYKEILNYFTPKFVYLYNDIITDYNSDSPVFINFIELLHSNGIRINNSYYLKDFTTIKPIEDRIKTKLIDDTLKYQDSSDSYKSLVKIKLSDTPFPEQKLLSPYNPDNYLNNLINK